MMTRKVSCNAPECFIPTQCLALIMAFMSRLSGGYNHVTRKFQLPLCLFLLKDILFWLSFYLYCRVSLEKTVDVKKEIDKNGIHLVRWGCNVIPCLRLGWIFFYSNPCPCIPFSFVVGINVRFFRASLRSGQLFISGSFQADYTCLPDIPFCAPCLKLISATYWLTCYRLDYLYGKSGVLHLPPIKYHYWLFATCQTGHGQNGFCWSLNIIFRIMESNFSKWTCVLSLTCGLYCLPLESKKV